MSVQQAENIIAFLQEIQRLKTVPRLGWLLRGVRSVESVADHSYGVALIAMLLADRAHAQGAAVNVETVLRMALLHDITEARSGDLPATIKRYFPAGALAQADAQMAHEIFARLGQTGAAYDALWHEYEQRQSLEARLVKAADKLDLLLQALVYEQGGARNLQEFWANAAADFAKLELQDLVADWLAELHAQRPQASQSSTQSLTQSVAEH